MRKNKQNKTSKEENKTSMPEINITKKANVIPAKPQLPDQTILNKPAPKQGMSLKESWNGRIK